MKRPYAKPAFWIAILILLMGASPVQVYAQTCLNCHKASEFKGKFVHSPVKTSQCQACHNPHVSKYKGLLVKPLAPLCYGCHAQLEKKISGSPYGHDPAANGKCNSCHQPHAAEFSGLMKSQPAVVCSQCHVQEEKKSYKVLHSPYANGQCIACHEVHGGASAGLLRAPDPGMCLKCHAPGTLGTSAHRGQDPGKMQCLKCHHPHGAADRSLIRKVRHSPYADGNCRVCHDRPDDIDVCLNCHKNLADSFNFTHTHLQGNGVGNPCSKCHTPHAADNKAMLPGSAGACRICHADTFNRRDKALYKHGGWNNCTECHQLHGADDSGMLRDAPDKVCGRCHGRHVNFGHPSGEKSQDPRNGRPIGCVTCHDPCSGTMYKHQLRGSVEGGLCTECHLRY